MIFIVEKVTLEQIYLQAPAHRPSVHHHPIGLTIQRVVTFSALGCWFHLSDLLAECGQNVFCSENYKKHINIKLVVKIKKFYNVVDLQQAVHL